MKFKIVTTVQKYARSAFGGDETLGTYSARNVDGGYNAVKSIA